MAPTLDLCYSHTCFYPAISAVVTYCHEKEDLQTILIRDAVKRCTFTTAHVSVVRWRHLLISAGFLVSALESGLSHMLGVSWLSSVRDGFREASQQTGISATGPSPPYSPPCYHSKFRDRKESLCSRAGGHLEIHMYVHFGAHT